MVPTKPIKHSPKFIVTIILATAVILSAVVFAFNKLNGAKTPSAKVIINTYKIESIYRDVDDQINVNFSNPVHLPKRGKTSARNFKISYAATKHHSNDTLTLLDQDSDDLYWVGFVVKPSKHQLTFQYSNQTDEYNENTEARTMVTYSVTGTTLHEIKRTMVVGNSTNKGLQRIIAANKVDLEYMLAHKLSFAGMTALTRYLARHGASYLTAWNHREKKAAKTRERRIRNDQHAFLKTTYAPNYTDDEWRAAITKRAATMGIKNPKISTVTITDTSDFSVNYDYTLTHLLDADFFADWDNTGWPIGGCYGPDTGAPNDQRTMYFVTGADGTKYIVVLPLRLLTAKAVKEYKVGTESNYYYVSNGVEANDPDFIQATDIPTTTDVVNNIVLGKEQ